MSAARRKGTAAETVVVRWLREYGFPHAERRAMHGAADLGDVTGIPGVVIEIKNKQRMELAAWVDEAAAEADNAGGDPVWAVWHKRRGFANPQDWYVTMTGEQFARLLWEAGYSGANPS